MNEILVVFVVTTLTLTFTALFWDYLKWIAYGVSGMRLTQ